MARTGPCQGSDSGSIPGTRTKKLSSYPVVENCG